MLGKILDFICTRLRSTEIALDSLSLVQYDFCRTKTRANKIPYFTKHCRITYNYFQMKNCNIFLIFAQNIDWRFERVPTIYVLEQKKEKSILL